jgi:hypothetical protein
MSAGRGGGVLAWRQVQAADGVRGRGAPAIRWVPVQLLTVQRYQHNLFALVSGSSCQSRVCVALVTANQSSLENSLLIAA